MLNGVTQTCVEYAWNIFRLIYFYIHLFTHELFIYWNLTIICIIINVTINMTIVSLYEVSVIAQWIGHLPAVHDEVVSSPLAWRQKVFWFVATCITQDLCCHFQHKYLCQVNTNVCLSYMTKVLCSGEHKFVCGQHMRF